ncbi:hypothetical protein GCM10022270_29830 [Terriglobus aquaticus]
MICAIAGSLACAHLPQLLAQTGAREPGPAVARMSLIDGEVHVASAGYNAEAVDAALNMPIGPGQSVRTGANADSEVEFPDGSVLRLAAGSSATLIRLQPQTEIGLDDGLYYLELRAGTDPQFVVYAGEVSVAPLENASIRVRVQNGQPEVAVLRGSVSVTRPNSYTVDVQQGESLRADAKDSRRYLLAEGVADETADRWNERRAQQLADSSASQTIAREDYAGDQGYGWSDLDSNGAWYPLPGEGLVWQPYGADASFDPYGFGNWVYAGFAGGGGYVWASGYPWGWLPYHCGSWSFYPGFGWGWLPAAGCRSYGGGWPVGGLPVKNAPHGWRPPLPVRPPATGGIVVRHPTLPGAPQNTAVHQIAQGPRQARSLEWNGVTLQPLKPIAAAPIARGSSAVGSALRRDFPLQDGTHVPVLGRESTVAAVMPGRAPEWHAPTASQTRSDEADRTVPRSAPTSAGLAASGHATSQESPAGPVNADGAGGVLAAEPVLSTGWHSRVYSNVPPAANRPAPGGSVVIRPAGVRAVPAGAGPVLPPATRPASAIAPPVRPAPVTIAPPRIISPPPAPVQHSSPPPPAPVFHSAPPPAPSAAPATHSK